MSELDDRQLPQLKFDKIEPANDFIPTGVLAQEFNYATDHIGLLIRTGKIEGKKVGKRWLASRLSLVTYRDEVGQRREKLLNAQRVAMTHKAAVLTSTTRVDEDKRNAILACVEQRRNELKAQFASLQILNVPSKVLSQRAESTSSLSRAGEMRPSTLFSQKPSVFRRVPLALFICLGILLLIGGASTPSSTDQAGSLWNIIRSLFRSHPIPEYVAIIPSPAPRPVSRPRATPQYSRVGAVANTTQQYITQYTTNEYSPDLSKLSLSLSDQHNLIETLRASLTDLDRRTAMVNYAFGSFPRSPGSSGYTTNPNPSTLSVVYLGATDIGFSGKLTQSGSGAVTLTGPTTIDSSLTVSGAMSFGSVTGAGLTDCDAAADTLNWDATSGKFSCGSDTGGSVSSNSLDFDEFVNSMTLDANLTIASAGYNINFGGINFLNIGSLATGTGDEATIGGALQVGGTTSVSYSRFGTNTTTHSNYISAANDLLISGDLSVVGTGSFNIASASQYWSGGLTSCTGSNILQWTGGSFSCAAAASSGISGIEVAELGVFQDTAVASLSFDPSSFNITASGSEAVRISLDYANGPASRSINQTITGNRWTFVNTEDQGTVSGSYGLFGALQIAGFSSTSYSRFGTATTGHSNYISAANDLLISGDLEVDGSASFAGPVSVSGNFTLPGMTAGSVLFAGTGGLLSQDNANLYWDDTNNRFGLLTTAPSTVLEIQGTASASYGLFGALQIAGFSSTSYSRFGTNTTGYSNFISAASDLLISGDFEVDASAQFDSFVRISNTATASLVFRSGADNEKKFTIQSNYTSIGTTDRLSFLNGDNIELVSIASTGVTDIDTLRTGPMSFEDNAGIVSWVNMEITSASSGTIMSYTAQIDSSPVLTIYGQTDASNGVSNRRVGILTADPTTVLEIQGTASASYFLTQNTIQVGGTTASVAYSRFGTATTTHAGSISTSNDLLISGDLEVDGSVAFDGFALFGGNATISGGLTVTDLGTPDATNDVCRSSANRIINCSSSIRYKENIGDLKVNKEALLSLRPVSFTWKGSGTPDVGLIAEEVREQIPELTFDYHGILEGVKYKQLSVYMLDLAKEHEIRLNTIEGLTVEPTASPAEVRASESVVFDNLPTLTARIGSAQEELTTLRVGMAAFASSAAEFAERLDTITQQSANLASVSFNLTDRVIALEQRASSGLTFDNIAVFNGGLRVDEIGSVGSIVTLLSDVNFIGRPYFNADTGGFAQIASGSQEVRVTFDREYLDTPVINATSQQLLGDDIDYGIASASTIDFTIMLNKPAPKKVTFSWIALAVKNPKIFHSNTQAPNIKSHPQTTPTPEPSIIVSPASPSLGGPSFEPSPVASPSESPVPSETSTATPASPDASQDGPELTPTQTPESTPASSSEPIPEPTPEATPEPTPEITETPTPGPTPEIVSDPPPVEIPVE